MSGRIRKEIEKYKPINYTKKKEEKKKVLQKVLKKKIEKRQVELVKEIVKPFDNSKDLKVIRDTNNTLLYNGLYVDTAEILTKQILQVISEFPDNFLPAIFKGVVPLYIEKVPPIIKQTVLLSKLANGDYQSKSSKSDKGIADGIKTLLKIPELQKYDKDDLTEFVKNHREVFYEILRRCQENNLSLPTFKGYIVKLMRVLVIAFKGKTQPVYVKYASMMKDLMSATQNLDAQNSLNENEQGRFLDWKVIMAKQRELSFVYDNIEDKKNKFAYDYHLNLLIVSLYTLTPVLRREPMNLQFKQSGDTIEKDFVNVRRNEVLLELNLVKKKHDAIEIKCNDELARILRQSLELYPRKYLFTEARKYPIMDTKLGEDTVAERLRKLFTYTGKSIGPSILRSSYVTYRFDSVNGNLRNAQVEEMAKLMRTSSKYIYSSYRKITDTPIPMASVVRDDDGKVITFGVPSATVVSITQPEIAPVVDAKKDPYVKHNEAIKKKYSENEVYRNKTLNQQSEYRAKIGTTELQKRKIISMLRNSASYREKVKSSTLEKYNIKIDDYK